MANTVTIGRLTFTSPGQLNDSRSGNEHILNLVGTFVTETLDEVKYLRDELISCANGYYCVPFSWEGDSSLSGYVKVNSASVDTSRVRVGGYKYTIDLQWLGNMGETEFESQLSGALIQNDHSITSSTTQFYAPPTNHYSHDHSSTPNNFARTGEDGDIQVKYGSSIRSYNAKYLVDPVDFYKNGCKIFTDDVSDTSRLRCGLESPNNSPASTIIQNGLVKMTFTNDTDKTRFKIFTYDGNGYKSENAFAVSRGVSETEWQGWRSIQILKNTPEVATVRLTSYYDATTKDQRLTFDVTLRRGSRHFSIVASQWSSAQFNIKPTSTIAYNDQTSYAIETNNDADGNQVIIGSPQNFDVDTTDGGIESTASTATLKAFIGFVYNGTSAASIDTASNIRDQYLDNVYETVRLVKS
jgi:hypothetical protein|tara:strand:- start:12742 stop:13977 length:1236 start_codon:yes stop_codon:yes gene_type:complete